MSSQAKVFLVDDEPEILALLHEQFAEVGIECERFSRAEEVLARRPWDEVGCMITDLRMPGVGGRKLISQLQGANPVLSIVVYSASVDIVTAVEAMREGVHYVFEKCRSLDQLVPIVDEAIDRSRARFGERSAADKTKLALASLTARERQVLTKVAAGRPNKLIADELGISINTVEIHRGRVMRKMHAESVAELARALAAIGL